MGQNKTNIVYFAPAKEAQDNWEPICDIVTNMSDRQQKATLKHKESGSRWTYLWERVKPPSEKVVIFFPGDGQFTHDREIKEEPFSYWTIERTMELLTDRYPNCHILVVAASRHIRRLFSVYCNFVESNNNSELIPIHRDEPLAIPHLRSLLCSVQGKIVNEGYRFDILSGGLSMIGFSRGCFVLNRLLCEIGSDSIESFDQSDREFMDRFATLQWIDGGHSGPSQHWITNTGILKRGLVDRKIRVVVVVTSYQIDDIKRPVIAAEEHDFSNYLENHLTASFKREKINYQKPTLADHFEALYRIQ